MNLFFGQVYQRSRPQIDSLVKEEGSSENSEVWKIFVLRSEVLSFKTYLYQHRWTFMNVLVVFAFRFVTGPQDLSEKTNTGKVPKIYVNTDAHTEEFHLVVYRVSQTLTIKDMCKWDWNTYVMHSYKTGNMLHRPILRWHLKFAYTGRLLWPAMWYPITQLLHKYLHWSNSAAFLSNPNATLECPCRYSNRVAVWVLHGNSRVTSQEQPGYFSVGYQCSNCVIGYHIAGHSNLAV